MTFLAIMQVSDEVKARRLVWRKATRAIIVLKKTMLIKAYF